MGAIQRTSVPDGGPTLESSVLQSLLNFVESSLDADQEPFSIASSSTQTDKSYHNDCPLITESGRTGCPKAPVLKSSTTEEIDENTSMPELFLGPSSLHREFPCSLQPAASVASKAGGKESFQSSFPESSRTRPQKWYLHRAPSGKLTAIPPSPLCQEVTKTLFEKTEHSPGYAVIYAGYRIFSEDPRKSLGLVSESEMNETTAEKGGFDVLADVETPFGDISSYPFPSDDNTAYSSSSGSSTGTLSMRRDFHSGSKSLSATSLRPKSSAVEEDSLLDVSTVPFTETIQDSENSIKQTKHVSFSIQDYQPKTLEIFFNPPLKQELESEEPQAPQPSPPNAQDEFRMQFESRRGPAWNWVNKQLERLFLHAVNLSESEFVEFSCCDMKEVQAWLDEHIPHISRRSMERWVKANTLLKDAGIKPNELNEDVLDIFEWMTQQEQADFIKAYQRLSATVKASQEGLHLTQWEIEHFCRLSLADKIDFIERYKDRGEQRERTPRLDTASFTTNLPRFQRDQGQFPLAECSDVKFLQSQPSLTPKGEVPHKPILSMADNFYFNYLQFGIGQEKSGDASSISTHMRAPSSVSPSKRAAENNLDSALEQHSRRCSTTFTGDGCPPIRKLDTSTAIQEAGTIDKVSDETQDSITPWDSNSGPKEGSIKFSELLPCDSGEALEVAKGTPRVERYAEAPRFEAQSTDVDGKTLNNCLQDCGRLAKSLLNEESKWESTRKTLPTFETDGTNVSETLSLLPVVEGSSKQDWHGENPGANLPCPTPPPEELSAEGVISPITLLNDKPSTNICSRGVTPDVDTIQTLAANKSELYTPGQQTSLTSRGSSISYVTPPPHRTVRGLPSAYVSENDLRKVSSLERSPEKPKTLKKKFSTLWGSLRSKKSRDALKDLKYY